MMSDMLSREALMEYARNHVEHTIDCNDIARFPAVDAEPVRHGRWIETEYYDAHKTPIYQCSVCWKGVADHYIKQHNFCLHCGAKMNGGAEDDHQGT